MKILIYPDDRKINPYLDLLYKQLENKKEIKLEYISPRFMGLITLGTLLLPFKLLKYRFKKYDIFHLHWLGHIDSPIENKIMKELFELYFIFLIKFIKILGYKLIWTAHQEMPLQKRFPHDLYVRRILSKLCNAKIVHSKTTMKNMDKWGFDIRNTYVIPHGNYINSYKNNITKNVATKIFKFNKKEFIFLFFGIITKYKGIDTLLKAFKQLTKNRENTRLLIAGKCLHKDLNLLLSKYKEELESKLKLNIHFIEENKVQYYFNCADIIVCPFKKITTSGSIILALSFGKPIIYPRMGDLKELPNNLGFPYNPKDKKGLLNCMKKAIKNKKRLKQIGKNAFKYAEGLSWDKMADKTYKIYKEVLNQK